MKKLVVLLGCVLMGSVFLGCSNSSSSSESYTTVTFKGTFSGGVSPTSFSTFEGVADNPIVVMQNQGSKRVYLAEVKDDEFEFKGTSGMNQSLHTLDSDATHGTKFMAMLLNTDLEVAAVAIKESDEDNIAHTGIVVSKDVTVAIKFDFDAANKVMKMTNLDDSEAAIDTNYKVRLSTNKPTGMDGKFGKTVGGDNKPTVNPLDRDEDGRPDIFDGMNDGKVLDNTDITNKTEAKTSDDGGVVESSIMFMNLKKKKGDALSVTEDASVVLEVVPKAGKAGSIKEIKVAEMSSGTRLVHTNYKDSVIEEIPTGFTKLETYPAAASKWEDADYKLYKAKNLEGETVFTVLIKPKNNDFKPGDLIVLEVTTTSESKEYYFNTINFKFTDIPVDTSTWGEGDSGSGAPGTPYKILDTGGRVFSWNNPVDEDGVEVSGMGYRFELFHYKERCAAKTPEDQIGKMFTIDDRETDGANDISESEIDGDGTAKCLQVDITAHFPYGDNAAQILHIEREGWSGE